MSTDDDVSRKISMRRSNCLSCMRNRRPEFWRWRPCVNKRGSPHFGRPKWEWFAEVHSFWQATVPAEAITARSARARWGTRSPWFSAGGSPGHPIRPKSWRARSAERVAGTRRRPQNFPVKREFAIETASHPDCLCQGPYTASKAA